MKKRLVLVSIMAGVVLGACGSGSSDSGAGSRNTYGPYTTNGDPEVAFSISQGSSGTVSCIETSCTITGNGSLGLGLSFSGVSPQAYFALSPVSAQGITITPSGSNCNSDASSSPSCTYTFTCSGNGSGQFYYQLNGTAGTANLNKTPITIICSGF
jgi:hypothetical protein